VLAGCRGEKDEAHRAEAGRIAHAVEALRAAEASGRPPLLKALEQEACESADVCATKEKCLEAYGLERQALESLRAVRRAANADAPLPEQAPALLAQAESVLTRSREVAKACADLEGSLRRAHAL